jgi:hypothetical protein
LGVVVDVEITEGEGAGTVAVDVSCKLEGGIVVAEGVDVCAP